MQIVNSMFKLSESRGKEASGLALRSKESIYVLKEPITSSRLIKTSKYKNLFNETLKAEGITTNLLQAPILILGHSRLQTNGQSEINANNQPVVKEGAIGIHNGIIVNDTKLWAAFPALKKKYDVDTEVFLSLLQMFRLQGKSIIEATKLAFGQIEGSASVAVEFDDTNSVVLATNTGSLYMALSKNGKMMFFASEKFILQQILDNNFIRASFDKKSITQVEAGQGYLLSLNLSQETNFFAESTVK
jgi:glutamine---fructose-6-phosphate transaminase (isomerizing)